MAQPNATLDDLYSVLKRIAGSLERLEEKIDANHSDLVGPDGILGQFELYLCDIAPTPAEKARRRR